jgi:hypothetical protein
LFRRCRSVRFRARHHRANSAGLTSANFASLAAFAASAFLVSAALAATFAAAAAASLDFASTLAVSSCVPASAALGAAFCFRSAARALAWSVREWSYCPPLPHRARCRAEIIVGHGVWVYSGSIWMNYALQLPSFR